MVTKDEWKVMTKEQRKATMAQFPNGITFEVPKPPEPEAKIELIKESKDRPTLVGEPQLINISMASKPIPPEGVVIKESEQIYIDEIRTPHCSNCKHHIYNGDSWGESYHCKLTKIQKEDYSHKWFEYTECRELNSRNNCKKFEPSLWFKIKRFFGGAKC